MEITLSAEEVESRCLELLDWIADEGLIVVVTKNGRPLAKLLPMPAATEPLSELRKSTTNPGDVNSPLENE